MSIETVMPSNHLILYYPLLLLPSVFPNRLMSIESVMPFSHLILCHPLLLLPSIPPRCDPIDGSPPGSPVPGILAAGGGDAGRDWGQEEKGMTEDEMAEWHH